MKPLLKDPEIIVRDGKPVSVILPFQEYREMVELLENAGTTTGSAIPRPSPEGGPKSEAGIEWLERWESIYHLEVEDADSYAESMADSRGKLSDPKSPWE